MVAQDPFQLQGQCIRDKHSDLVSIISHRHLHLVSLSPDDEFLSYISAVYKI